MCVCNLRRKSCREWTSMRKPARIGTKASTKLHIGIVSYLCQTTSLWFKFAGVWTSGEWNVTSWKIMPSYMWNGQRTLTHGVSRQMNERGVHEPASNHPWWEDQGGCSRLWKRGALVKEIKGMSWLTLLSSTVRNMERTPCAIGNPWQEDALGALGYWQTSPYGARFQEAMAAAASLNSCVSHVP